MSINTINTLFKNEVKEQADAFKQIGITLQGIRDMRDQTQKVVYANRLSVEAKRLQNFAYYQTVEIRSDGITEGHFIPLAKTMQRMYSLREQLQDLSSRISTLPEEEVPQITRLAKAIDQVYEKLHVITNDSKFSIETEYDLSVIDTSPEEIDRILTKLTR